MAVCNQNCVTSPMVCPDLLGCDGTCPQFEIKQHDTKPPFTVTVDDCDGPIDLTDVVVEVNMWAKAKLRTAITTTTEYFGLADNIGFEQSLVGDIIVTERARGAEQMLIIGHDEDNKLIAVQRGYHGTPVGSYRKGSPIRIMRVINSFGEVQMVEEDIVQITGETETVLTESRVIYNWQAVDTCLPGCYYLEFKLLKMDLSMSDTLMSAPNFTSITPSNNGCGLGTGVEWARRVPTSGEGFLIRVWPTSTNELLIAP